ncbi:hypothetical protein Golob_018211, partial [Gossypium lobatum]|nr:hypothetical protein [Gossypium lobatum]
ERRYLLKEFPELVSCGDGCKVLEVGCGNGSTALPILRNETLQRAKEVVAASNVASVENRFWPFYCDFATTGFPKWLACANCRENLGQKDQICVSDVGEERTLETGSWSMEERSCCVGGVDFVTLFMLGGDRKKLNPDGDSGSYRQPDRLVHAFELSEGGIDVKGADFLDKMHVEELEFDLLYLIYDEYPEESEEGKPA